MTSKDSACPSQAPALTISFRDMPHDLRLRINGQDFALGDGVAGRSLPATAFKMTKSTFAAKTPATATLTQSGPVDSVQVTVGNHLLAFDNGVAEIPLPEGTYTVVMTVTGDPGATATLTFEGLAQQAPKLTARVGTSGAETVVVDIKL